MPDPRRAIQVGPHTLPWGTLLADAARLLGPGLSSTPVSVAVDCPAAYGFATMSARLTAAAPDRPVTCVEYELAPPGDPPYAPDTWMALLAATLGEPGSFEHRDLPGYADPADSVVFSAQWRGNENDVWLSTYGGPRAVDGGRSAGMLAITWSEDLAAHPFVDAWRSRNEALARAASGPISIDRFDLRYPASALYAADQTDDTSAAIEAWRRAREARLALHHPGVLDTPDDVARTLAPRRFAIWSSDAAGIWCLSSLRDSVAVPIGASATVDRVELKTARGPGYSELSVGAWAVRDVETSPGIAAAARRLAAIPGVTIRETGGYNC